MNEVMTGNCLEQVQHIIGHMLPATLYQGNPEGIHRICNIGSTARNTQHLGAAGIFEV
jgi:hypothetical protein